MSPSNLPVDVRSAVEVRSDDDSMMRLWMTEGHARTVRAFLGRWIGSA